MFKENNRFQELVYGYFMPMVKNAVYHFAIRYLTFNLQDS